MADVFRRLYLPAGGDRALLGDVVMGGLAGRLLQVFLDLPSAALLTRVKATRDARAASTKMQSADSARLWAQQAHLFEQATRQLEEAQTRLRQLTDDREPVESVTALAGAVTRLGSDLLTVEQNLRSASELHVTVRQQRQADEKTVNDVRESAFARAFFHSLDLVACPRCESPVTKARQTAERETHACAVCTSSVAVDESGSDREQVEREAQARLAASQRAEREAHVQLGIAARQADAVRAALTDAEQRLRLAEQAAEAGERAELTGTIARLEGVLSVVQPPPRVPTSLDDVDRVLDAAVSLLEADGTRASESLFAALNKAIVETAHRFGMRDLYEVKIDRAARLQVFKVGGPREWFGKQASGERLRLRIAVVVALIRVGTEYGLATHPGLLLIDSPKAEEVQETDATALFAELEQLASEIPGLQVVLTTIDEALAEKVLTSSNIIAPGARRAIVVSNQPT